MRQDHPESSCNQLPETQGISVSGGGWYNGYSPKERNDKFREMKCRIAIGGLPPASGPCVLCGDPAPSSD